MEFLGFNDGCINLSLGGICTNFTSINEFLDDAKVAIFDRFLRLVDNIKSSFSGSFFRGLGGKFGNIDTSIITFISKVYNNVKLINQEVSITEHVTYNLT